MDKRLGRKPNKPVSMETVVLELLRLNLTVTGVIDTDRVAKIFGPNGYQYTKRFQPRLTHADYAKWKARHEVFNREKQGLPGKENIVNGKPDSSNLGFLVGQARCPLVIFPIDYGRAKSFHLSLVYGITPNGDFRVYIPDDTVDELFWELPPAHMAKLYAKNEVLIGVSPSS